MERLLMKALVRDYITASERLSFSENVPVNTGGFETLDEQPNIKEFKEPIMMTFKSRAEIIQKRDKQIKAWANQRIRYWENVFLNNPKQFVGDDCAVAYDEGYERGQESGILDAFHQVVEFLDSQKKRGI